MSIHRMASMKGRDVQEISKITLNVPVKIMEANHV